MRKNIFLALMLIGSFSLRAQRITLTEIVREIESQKVIDEIGYGKEKIKYTDIQGTPYFSKIFINARIGDTSEWIPIRYDTFLDRIEILYKTDVYELPRKESLAKFTFEKTNEKLVFLDSSDENAGYYFEIASGQNRILKKVQTKFYNAIPAPNHMIAGTPPRFVKQDPIYFLKNQEVFIKLPKHAKELPSLIPQRKSELQSFIKSNKIKTNNEADLIKLAIFLNK